MNKEYRKAKRVMPSIHINIIDMIRGTQVGEVLNISATGLLVSSRSIVTYGELFQTEWQFSARGYKSISVGLECLWVEAQYTNFCLSGFQIIDISEDDQNILNRIISQSKGI